MNRKRDSLVLGSKVALVPYRPEHVEKYHGWMQSAELRVQTASEPLTLEQEYEMQKKWMIDNDKSTFIILDKKQYENTSVNEIDSMVGDVNLFFNEPDDSGLAEVEVMIAGKMLDNFTEGPLVVRASNDYEPSARRQGFAYEALVLMMCYAADELGVHKFRAKILESNTASLQLFKEKLKFQEVGHNAVFNEVVLELPVTAGLIKEKMMGIGLKENHLDWKMYFPKHDSSTDSSINPV